MIVIHNKGALQYVIITVIFISILLLSSSPVNTRPMVAVFSVPIKNTYV